MTPSAAPPTCPSRPTCPCLCTYAQHQQHQDEGKDDDEGKEALEAASEHRLAQNESATLGAGGGGQVQEGGEGTTRPRTPLERRLERSSMARYGEKHVPSPRDALPPGAVAAGVVSYQSLIGEAPTPRAAPRRASAQHAALHPKGMSDACASGA